MCVRGHDLAIDQAGGQVEGGERSDQRSEFIGPVLAVARKDADHAAFGSNHRAIAVELDLVHPVVTGWHIVHQSRELRLAEFRQWRTTALLRFRLLCIARGSLLHLREKGIVLLAGERIFARLVCGDFRHRAPRQHAGQRAFDQRIAFLDMFVLQLAQQPVLPLFSGLLLQSYQKPFALHAFSFEREVQISLLQIPSRLALDR